jgi:beta-phosphoglucomutase-like phosphatase (HAD superfamily)
MSYNPRTMATDPILLRILKDAEQTTREGRRFLAVFDLDSTLFDLTLRVSTIIEAFATDPAWRAKYPIECEILEEVQIRRTDWGIEDGLERVGLQKTEHPAFFRDLHQFWAECFFSDDFLHHDEPLPGAVAYVNRLRELGAHVMYLTGRDVPRMLKGTEKTLRDRGFPVSVAGVELVLKPSPTGQDDATFKRDILREASKTYSRIWLFENEPVNLNLVARDLPQIGLVYIVSTHSGREECAQHLARIEHFEVDAEAFTSGRGD